MIIAYSVFNNSSLAGLRDVTPAEVLDTGPDFVQFDQSRKYSA
jgi:hypothetical protein